MEARFRDRLQREFDRRKEKNSRYSLRAFAALLGTDHSTLSQILREQRRVPLGRVRSWARKLELDPEETAAYIAAEHLPDRATTARNSQVRHWTAEAMAVLTDHAHWQIFDGCRQPGFQNDSRWLAGQLGCSVDQVNVAFTRLLRLGLIETGANGEWITVARPVIPHERAFRNEALLRVRKKAVEAKVDLPPPLTKGIR